MHMVLRITLVLSLFLVAAVAARAEAEGGLLWDRGAQALIVPPVVYASEPPEIDSVNRPTLFAGTSGSSLFAPYPVRHKAPYPSPSITPAARILDLIASAEAGRAGYDAVVWAARIKPPKPPTQMTLGEIEQWISATPRQHHAIGRYQFIPSTLRRLVRITGAGPSQRFTPTYQDQLAKILLDEAGMQSYHNRDIGRVTFMNNLAKIWAGLPNSSGRSHYHGYAGNKATITWAQFSAEMAAIYDS